MRSSILLLACLASMSLSVQAGELYRWVDSSGKVNYGDVLPPGAMQVEVKKFPKDTTSSEYLPYETLRAQQNFPVTLYVADNCGEACAQARNSLNKRGIPFNEKALKTKQDIEAFKKLSGFDALNSFDAFVPTLAVGKNFIKGFEESQWNSELDIAGYPKTASYRRAPPSSPAETPSAEGRSSEGQPSESQTSPGEQ